MKPRLFVTGTDTNVGKTQVSAALLRLWVAAGLQPHVFKPYESGMASLQAPQDSLALQEAAGGWQALADISWARFRRPLAPGMAVRLASADRRRIHARVFHQVLRRVEQTAGALLVEGAGGLHVPLDEKHDVINLIEALALPVLVVARAGLGTINHTTLTLEALRARKCEVAAVVLNRTSAVPDAAIALNVRELQRRFPRTTMIGPLPYVADPQRRLPRLGNQLRVLNWR